MHAASKNSAKNDAKKKNGEAHWYGMARNRIRTVRNGPETKRDGLFSRSAVRNAYCFMMPACTSRTHWFVLENHLLVHSTDTIGYTLTPFWCLVAHSRRTANNRQTDPQTKCISVFSRREFNIYCHTLFNCTREGTKLPFAAKDLNRQFVIVITVFSGV
jgi:hypothetical protein